MEANTAAKVSVAQTTNSSLKSWSVGSSPNRFALLATFAAWAAMWRGIAEQHANELQKTVEAAAAWRSQMRGRFAKTAPSKGTVSWPVCRFARPLCRFAETAQTSVTEDLQDSKAQVDGELEEGHDIEIQRALEAASAWRSHMQKQHSGSSASNWRGGGLDGGLSDNLSHRQVEITSDAHDAELQEALDAAAKWRSRFQSKEHVQKNEPKECVGPSQNGSSHESNLPCNFKTKSPLTAIMQGDFADSGSTTAASGDEGSCASSDSSDASPTCWVFGAYLRDVSKISADGVSSRGHRVRLYAGPWGRSGLCRRNEEVLVYIDVLGARTAGAEFRYSQRGLVLAEGVIPAACCRKMVMIKDGSVLYDRISLEPQRT